MAQIRNILKLIGSLTANEVIGDQSVTSAQLQKLYDDQLYDNTGAKSIYVDNGDVSLTTPAEFEPTDSTNYRSVNVVGSAALLIDDDVDNAAYSLSTLQKESTGYGLSLASPTGVTKVKVHNRVIQNSLDGEHASDKVLFGSGACGASRQESDAATVFGSGGEWWPENLGTTDTVEDWIWKDIGQLAVLSGLEIECKNVIGIRIQRWTGAAGPTEGQLDGDSDWTDVSLSHPKVGYSSNYYYLSGSSLYADSKHQIKFANVVRLRYIKIHFLFNNQEVYNETNPLWNISKTSGSSDWGSETAMSQTNVVADSDYIFTPGYRLRSLATGRVNLNANASSSIKIKRAKQLGTYDWNIVDIATITIPDMDAAYNQSEYWEKRYDITPYFVPRDGEDWYLAYYATGYTLGWFLTSGARHKKSGDLTGNQYAFTPDSYSPHLSFIYLPQLSITSIRGISPGGLVIEYYDSTGVEWISVPIDQEPKIELAIDYPVEDLYAGDVTSFTQGSMQYRLLNNCMAIGPSTTGALVDDCAEISGIGYADSTGIIELEFELAMAEPWGDNYLVVGLHKFNNTDPSRDVQGYRDDRGLYLIVGDNGDIKIVLATASSSTTYAQYKNQGIALRRLDDAATESNQYFTNVKLTIDLTTQTWSVFVNKYRLHSGDMSATVITDLGAQVGWSVSVSGSKTVSDVDQEAILIRNLKFKWSGTTDSRWLATGELLQKSTIDPSGMTIKSNDFYVTDGKIWSMPEISNGSGERLFQDGYAAYHKGNTVQSYLDKMTDGDSSTYCVFHPSKDVYISAYLDEVQLISNSYITTLEDRYLINKIDAWMYGEESSDIYWSDARDWGGVQTRYGANFAGQWGYISQWNNFSDAKWHNDWYNSCALIDRQFAFPFYKFATTHNYLTGGALDGWSWDDQRGGTTYTLASNYSSTKCAVLDADWTYTNLQRPRGIYFTRSKPDFANNEVLHIGMKINPRAAHGSIGGNAIGWYDYNNDYRSMYFGTTYSAIGSLNLTQYYRYTRASASRSAGDYSGSDHLLGYNEYQGGNLSTDGGAYRGGWSVIGLRWQTATSCYSTYWIDNGTPEYVTANWNNWNVMDYFSDTLRVGIYAGNYADLISSFIMFEGWVVPSDWPLTEFREYNSKKSVGLAGCWGNNSFTFSFDTISSDSYYLWAYVAGASQSATEIGNVTFSDQAGEYTLNTASPYDGAWVQIGSSAIALTASTVLSFTPSSAHDKSDYTNTTAIKGICAKKSSGAPSDSWIPRGYLGEAERCRAAYTNPDSAKITSRYETNNKKTSKETRCGPPSIINIEPDSPRNAKLIEVASTIDSRVATVSTDQYTHTFDYYYDYKRVLVGNMPVRGMKLYGAPYIDSCNSKMTNSSGLVISSTWSAADYNRRHGLFSEPFYIGAGFECIGKVVYHSAWDAQSIFGPVVQRATTFWCDAARWSGIYKDVGHWYNHEARTYRNGNVVVSSDIATADEYYWYPWWFRIRWDGTNSNSGWYAALSKNGTDWINEIQYPDDSSKTFPIDDSTPVMIGFISPTNRPNHVICYESLSVKPGEGGTKPVGFDDDDFSNDFAINAFVPIGATFIENIEDIRISHFADSLWMDSTSDHYVITQEVEVEYTQIPRLVFDFTGDDSYYITSISYYTDDLNAMSDVTISVAPDVSTGLTDLSLSAIQDGVRATSVPASQVIRVTHVLGRYDTAIVHANQLVVDFVHSEVDWGIDGSQTLLELDPSPMGDYSIPVLCRVYNPGDIQKDAYIGVPSTYFGQYMEVSDDGVTYVGQGEGITLSAVPAHGSSTFWLRTNVPEGASTAGTTITRLIFARWLG